MSALSPALFLLGDYPDTRVPSWLTSADFLEGYRSNLGFHARSSVLYPACCCRRLEPVGNIHVCTGLKKETRLASFFVTSNFSLMHDAVYELAFYISTTTRFVPEVDG